ncbi:MAG: acyl-CoA thioesterase [Fimbriimonadia bacterium]|nr:acyl-CoA thioesterase [Fimbriimonadia bacterium]
MIPVPTRTGVGLGTLIDVENGKSPQESAVTLTQMMHPEHANPLGNVHGGWILKLIDEAGGIAAARHARLPAVTAEIDTVSFREAVHVGNLVHVNAKLIRSWRTSMEAEVIVEAEDLLSGERRVTSVAYLVFVALDFNGKPTPVVPVIPETPEEKLKWEQADKRRQERLARREQERANLSLQH